MLTMEIVWEVRDATLNLAEINAELTNPPPSSSHYQWNIRAVARKPRHMVLNRFF